MEYFLGFLIFIGTAFAVYLCYWLHEEKHSAKRRQAQRRKNEELALALSPTYQQKVEHDRQYTLATRKLDMEEVAQAHKQQMEADRHLLELMRFEHERWQGMHIIEDGR